MWSRDAATRAEDCIVRVRLQTTASHGLWTTMMTMMAVFHSIPTRIVHRQCRTRCHSTFFIFHVQSKRSLLFAAEWYRVGGPFLSESFFFGISPQVWKQSDSRYVGVLSQFGKIFRNKKVRKVILDIFGRKKKKMQEKSARLKNCAERLWKSCRSYGSHPAT